MPQGWVFLKKKKRKKISVTAASTMSLILFYSSAVAGTHQRDQAHNISENFAVNFLRFPGAVLGQCICHNQKIVSLYPWRVVPICWQQAYPVVPEQQIPHLLFTASILHKLHWPTKRWHFHQHSSEPHH